MRAHAGENVEKEEYYSIAVWIANWYDHSVIKLVFFQILEINPYEDPAIPLINKYSKDTSPYHKKTCLAMFLVALFIIYRRWKQPRCPSTEEWIKKCGTFTKCSTTQELQTKT